MTRRTERSPPRDESWARMTDADCLRRAERIGKGDEVALTLELW